jgi:site-specific recombinase XerD
MKSEKWTKIGKITEEWVKRAYPNYKSQDVWRANDRLNAFLEYVNMTDSEFVETYKQAKDRTEWARNTGEKVVEYYNELLKKYSINTARCYVSSARAFCRDNCQSLIIMKRRIAKPERAKNEHEFTREELAKMYAIADTRDKAILSTAIALGFSVEDFSELPREQIESLVNKAIAEKIDFIGFDTQRGKTKVESRSHLTPEARDSLKEWFAYIDKKRESEGKHKSKYVFPNGNDDHLSDQAINDIIKDLIKKANIMTTGKIRFHLLRKFLMNALHDSGFDDWANKRVMGKEIPTSDSTYLQGLNRKLDEDFPKLYNHIKLSTYTNKNGVRLEELEEKFKQQDRMIKYLMAENVLLKQSITSENIIEAIRRLRKEGKLTIEQIEAMKACGTVEEKTTLEELEPIK